MILQKTDKSVLIRHISGQMRAHGHGITALQSIVQTLVVAVIEPLLQERPFEIPVNLGDEEKPRIAFADRRDDSWPVLRFRRPHAPGPRKYVISHEHRHV